MKFDEISILISLALKLLIIELIFIDIDLNHYDSMEINDLPFYEEFDFLLRIDSLKDVLMKLRFIFDNDLMILKS